MIGEFIHGDCLKGMKDYPDNHFDLAIVDPPYGLGDCISSKSRHLHHSMEWNEKIPDKEYFDELYRVSKNQIIWGENYFSDFIINNGRIVHDKCVGQKNPASLSEGDIASQSFNNLIKIFRHVWRGNVQGNIINWDNSGIESRIHPTQKPIALYRYCLKKYAKEGDLILDTHVGSASSLIACEDMGFKYVGYELDKDYYDAAMKRLQNHIAQIKIEYS